MYEQLKITKYFILEFKLKSKDKLLGIHRIDAYARVSIPDLQRNKDFTPNAISAPMYSSEIDFPNFQLIRYGSSKWPSTITKKNFIKIPMLPHFKYILWDGTESFQTFASTIKSNSMNNEQSIFHACFKFKCNHRE